MPGRWAKGLGRVSLPIQLGALALAVALPLIFASALIIDRLVQQEQQRVRENLLLRAKALSALVDNEVETHAALGWALAHSPTLLDGDLVRFRQEAAEAVEFAPGAWVTMCAPDGRVVLSTFAPVGETPLMHAAPEIVRQAFAAGKAQVADLTFGPATRQLVTFVEVPVVKDGRPAYSISIGLSPSRFLELFHKKIAGDEIIGLLDRRQRFIARIPDHDLRFGQLAAEGWRRAIEQSPEGLAEFPTLEGVYSITAYAPTASGWTLGIGLPTASLEAPARALQWRATSIALTLVALSALLAFLMGRRIVRGMAELTEVAARVGRGETVVAPVASFREAQAIGFALADASVELKRRGDLLTRDKEALEAQVAERTADLKREMAAKLQAESRLRQSQKMESLGQLAGGVAHDFNNMLTIVIGSLDMAKRRLAGDDAAGALKFIGNAAEGARRAATLTARLLAFSRQTPLQPAVVDPNKLVGGMSELLRRTLGDAIEVETVLAGGVWPVRADTTELESAIVNLAVNARDAMPTGGKLTIETANSELDDRYAAAHPEVKAGQYVMISVTDSGEGMAEPVRQRAFEPFFTTKAAGQGTGLGLSQVFGFVKQSSGHVKIYSEEGRGTSVKVYLPRVLGQEIDATIPSTESGHGPENASVTVLAVEDEQQVRETTTAALRELGYRVLEAGTPSEALRLLDAHPEIDLLFTDVVLPEMNGKRLADAATERRPGLKTLFTTGYTRNAVVHNGVVDPGVAFIAKPFTTDELARKLERVLRKE